jgi:hypothetical protein
MTKQRQRRHWAEHRKPDFLVGETPVWRAPDDEPGSLLTYWYSTVGPCRYDFGVRELPGYSKADALADRVQPHHFAVIANCIRSSLDPTKLYEAAAIKEQTDTHVSATSYTT